MKKLSCLLLFFLLLACNKPERYSVYQSLLRNDLKVQVLYVGKNWEIKDAVEKREIEDGYFHSAEFWSSKETLVVIRFAGGYGSLAIPLERFSKEYKLIKPD